MEPTAMRREGGAAGSGGEGGCENFRRAHLFTLRDFLLDGGIRRKDDLFPLRNKMQWVSPPGALHSVRGTPVMSSRDSATKANHSPPAPLQSVVPSPRSGGPLCPGSSWRNPPHASTRPWDTNQTSRPDPATSLPANLPGAFHREAPPNWSVSFPGDVCTGAGVPTPVPGMITGNGPGVPFETRPDGERK